MSSNSIRNKERFKKLYQEKFAYIHGKNVQEGTTLERYQALAYLIRDEQAKNWIATNKRYDEPGQKQVYYFSIEFLLGRMLGLNLLNTGLREVAQEALQELGIDLAELEKCEADAGLGNGGLGRLGACFLDSMASLGIAGHGCGIRYKYGLFKQKIVDGFQVELPDEWLKNDNPWEIKKASKAVEVKFGGHVRTDCVYGRLVFYHEDYEVVKAVPYDMPMIGYRNGVVNTLRLWSAEPAKKDFDFSTFNRGEYLKAAEYKSNVEAISQILYPDDSNQSGKTLRLKQQYFFVSAGVQSIVKRYKKKHGGLEGFADCIAIHINDTHPALCIPELMRILIDEEGMGWDEAWSITTKVVSYTNHTIMPEALERWPIDMFKSLLPRIYLIIEEIDRRLGLLIMEKFHGNWQKAQVMAIISGGQIKMANLAVVGSHSVNGVSKVHSEILQNHLLHDFNKLYPGKFKNVTNGISHRRFLIKSNPGLRDLFNETIGTDWITDPVALEVLVNYAEDPIFQNKLAQIKKKNKEHLAEYIRKCAKVTVDPNSIFDVHVKRIHAYKRQLLNVLHIMAQYNQLRENPDLEMVPRTYIFAGKAAPGYKMAKTYIKLINTLAAKINNDPLIKDKIKVVFLENYNVSLAEIIIPAADVSQQISTASKEASGTGNMKFMMNGAVTLATLDGANIEIHEAVGDDNIVIFGLTVPEVLAYYRDGGYNALEVCRKDSRLNQVMDQLINGFFPVPTEEFRPVYDSLLVHNDEFFVLKDFASYYAAQERIAKLYQQKNLWNKMCIHNIAYSGRFYSDRTISEYSRDIWHIALDN